MPVRSILHYLEVIKTYTEGIGIELISSIEKDGNIDLDELASKIDDSTACVLIQTPNFLGYLENMAEIDKLVHANPKVLLIALVDPISLAILNSPAEYKADIVVGEGQALGNSQSLGGPLFGFLASNMKLARKMPGRIVGATKDTDGTRCYALTLQAREQHIRRDKATSNICSNQALCNLAATVHMCLLGKEGIREVALQSTTKAHYLGNKLKAIEGISLYSEKPFFKEFAIKFKKPVKHILADLKKKNIFGGVDISDLGYKNSLLIAVTEKKRKLDLDELVTALKEVMNG